MPTRTRSLAAAKKTKVIAFSGGRVSFLHDDTLTAKLRTELGADCKIKRASHVEPNKDGLTWDVDLRPVGGPVKRGFFKTRDSALAFEVDWIQKNVLGGRATRSKGKQ